MSKKPKKKRVWKRKYGKAKPTGQFASKLENTMWNGLKETLPKDHTIQYESTKLPYVLEKQYIPDFVVTGPDGRITYLEVKGYFRPTDRTKLLAVKRKDPSLDIRLCFDRNNKIHSKSNTLYSDWCEKHGFKYCFGEIPDSWFRRPKDRVQKRRRQVQRRTPRRDSEERSVTSINVISDSKLEQQPGLGLLFKEPERED